MRALPDTLRIRFAYWDAPWAASNDFTLLFNVRRVIACKTFAKLLVSTIPVFSVPVLILMGLVAKTICFEEPRNSEKYTNKTCACLCWPHIFFVFAGLWMKNFEVKIYGS